MIEQITALLANPLFWKIIVGYWIFSSLISPLPRPTQASSWFYVYVFGVLHTFGGNLNRAALVFKLPGVQQEHDDSPPPSQGVQQ